MSADIRLDITNGKIIVRTDTGVITELPYWADSNAISAALKGHRPNGMAPDMVNHPPHYTTHPSGVECIQITRYMTFDIGNAFKYVFRSSRKNGRQDIEKARWYLRDALRHAVFPFTLGGFSTAKKALDAVVEAEPDHNRVRFYRHIADGDLLSALGVIEDMLG